MFVFVPGLADMGFMKEKSIIFILMLYLSEDKTEEACKQLSLG
jgi:hypothetical protein